MDKRITVNPSRSSVLDGLQNVNGKGVETYASEASGNLAGVTTSTTRDALERRLDEIDRKLSEVFCS